MTIKEETERRIQYGADLSILSGKYTHSKLHSLHGTSRITQPNNKQLDFTVGCYYCGKIFNGKKIKSFAQVSNKKKKVEYAAICPHCHIDSVLFSTDITITKELLADMYVWWFQAHFPMDMVMIKEKAKKKLKTLRKE